MAFARTLMSAGTFDSLRIRSYRLYWFGQLAAESVFHLSHVAQGWLVYQLTGSAAALGWVGAGRAVASLLITPWGGVLSDRVDKRLLVLGGSLVRGLNMLVLGLLVWLGAVQYWHLVVGVMLDGTIVSFMMGAQSALVGEIVPRQTLMNALSIHAVGLGITAMLFPAIGGGMIALLGAANVFFLGALLHGVSFLIMWRLPAVPARDVATQSPFRALADGVRFTAAQPVLTAMMVVTLARFTVGMSYSTFMPKFADEVLGFDAAGLGLLLSASGLGALLASLFVASLQNYRHKGQLLLITGLVMGGLLLAMTTLRSAPLVFVTLVLLGACSNTLRITNQTLLQSWAGPRYRGRVMSLYGVAMGSGRIADVPFGMLGDLHGIPAVLGIQGGVMLAVFAGLGLRCRDVRCSDAEPANPPT